MEGERRVKNIIKVTCLFVGLWLAAQTLFVKDQLQMYVQVALAAAFITIGLRLTISDGALIKRRYGLSYVDRGQKYEYRVKFPQNTVVCYSELHFKKEDLGKLLKLLNHDERLDFLLDIDAPDGCVQVEVEVFGLSDSGRRDEIDRF